MLPPGFGPPSMVLVSPLLSAGGSAGALLLIRRAGRAGFDWRDVELAREFAARAGAALATADLHAEQAHLARVLQASLLPPELPTVPGMLVTADGTVTPVLVGGMPVGALTVARFAEARVHLDPGDLLLAYTNGVTEARGPRDGAMFGAARLRAALASAAGQPPAALIDRVLQAVDDWLDGQAHDDIAMRAVCASTPV
ncbi:PP2C family protein-serine/threonine phosphatase [Micromonospora luteifusca]|uniref:PP2C family protein-serine/threonine phosphatase n=1 Tax=Micromonospora luteifusca TaxID=709860 RepID=UPI0033B09FF0